MPNTKIERFPDIAEDQKLDANPAIQLFGRRFFKAQTIVEYLAEFLLVVSSPKSCGNEQRTTEPFIVPFEDSEELIYYPPTRLPLKFFSFFASSKLETRHRAHQKEYKIRLNDLKSTIDGCSETESAEFVRALQNLLGGFVGVAKSRTWTTHAFLPVNRSLLGREVMWAHTKASTDSTEWSSISKHFEVNRHNFMARGGELLYLQLLNLFNSERAAALGALWKQPEYAHLFEGQANITNVLRELCCSLSSNLIELMAELDDSLGLIASFISTAMHDLDETRLRAAPAHCGWVPKESLPEAILFAWEMNNVCSAQIDALEKVQILQTMCTVQVLRSLCFQAARHHGHNNSNLSFMGNYAWVIFAGDKVEGDVRKLAAHNYEAVEKLILYAIQSGDHRTTLTGRADIKADAQEDSNLLFRKRGKDLGLIVPPTGSPMRFFLPEHILRMLVTGLIPPGTRMRLDQFESRLFHHYGMAISGLHLREAAEWTNPELPEKTVWTETGWLADSLNSAGFLIPLSDAISIVQNPFGA